MPMNDGLNIVRELECQNFVHETPNTKEVCTKGSSASVYRLKESLQLDKEVEKPVPSKKAKAPLPTYAAWFRSQTCHQWAPTTSPTSLLVWLFSF